MLNIPKYSELTLLQFTYWSVFNSVCFQYIFYFRPLFTQIIITADDVFIEQIFMNILLNRLIACMNNVW